MPKFNDDHRRRLGEKIEPFGRKKDSGNYKGEVIGDGEVEWEPCERHFYNANGNGYPPNLVTLTKAEIDQLLMTRKYPPKCYLWVIDDDVKIIWEQTSNIKRPIKSIVCHTNLTGGKPAYIGGEMFFAEDGTCFINHFSGRFGNPDEDLWKNTLDVLRDIGFGNIHDLCDDI